MGEGCRKASAELMMAHSSDCSGAQDDIWDMMKKMKKMRE